MTETVKTRKLSEHAIPVTQWLNLEPAHVYRIRQPIQWITYDDDLAKKAKAILARGLVFEMQVLDNGQVEMTVVDNDLVGCIMDVEVSENEKGKTDAAMERLISRAHGSIMRRAS